MGFLNRLFEYLSGQGADPAVSISRQGEHRNDGDSELRVQHSDKVAKASSD